MQTYSARNRRVKPTASKPGFALGLDAGRRLLRSWASGGYAFDLLEDSLWADRDNDPSDSFRFRLHWVAGGEPRNQGFDTQAQAETMARHISTPLPAPDASTAEHNAAFDAFIAVEDMEARRQHGREDEVWWSIATSAPIMPVCGGSPEPEPVCSESGWWFVPGDEDLEPAVRELSDDASGAFTGHDA